MKKLNLKYAVILLIALSTNCLKAQGGDSDPGNPQGGASNPCLPAASTWYLGGNNIIGPAGWNPDEGCFTCPLPVSDAGTCNNFPFILKANNFQSVFIQPSGNIGINVPFPAAVLDIMSASSGNQSRFKIFGDQNGNVESSSDINMNFKTGSGHAFNVNEGPAGSSTNLFTVLSGGNVGIGDLNPNAKLVVNDRVSNVGGIAIGAGMTSGYAFGVFDPLGAGSYLIYPDGKTRISTNMQIGFPTVVGMADPNPRLNIDATSMPGLKLSSNNTSLGQKMIYVENINNPGYPTFEVHGDGTTYIGTDRPATGGSAVAANAKLAVDGMILTREIRVSNSTGTHWADFVFEKDYKLMSLNEIENYVAKNKHLPNVPSEAEVKKDGVDLMEMNVQLLQKVEELYLHTIALKKQLDEQSLEISKLKKK